MTRIVEPFIRDLRQQVLKMGRMAEAIVAKSMASVFDHNASLASEVPKDDLEIDRADVIIDEMVLRALALQAPVADDLRQVISIKMMATDLERVGDLARNIAKCAVRLIEKEDVVFPSKLEDLSVQSQRLLQRSLDSFSESDSDRAEMILAEDDLIDADQDIVVAETVKTLMKHPEISSQGVDIILIAKHLERIADHATNIAEEVIYWTDGRNVKHQDKLNSD